MDKSSKAPAKRSGERRASDRRDIAKPFAGSDRREGERRSGAERRAHRD